MPIRERAHKPAVIEILRESSVKTIRSVAVSLTACVALCACEPVQTLQEYRPVVDPAKIRPAKFEADLEHCRSIALKVEAEYKQRQEKEMQQQLVAGILLGALVGAAAGNHTGYQGDYIAAGAATGAIAAAGSGDYSDDLVTYGPRRVVDRCMTDRGYKILTDPGRA
ncbi:glycine zipper family protein [Rhodobacter capsulatus]|uniref:glycine zipper family protein n=1 Tax=Rhodobacter capsulatus TaxID=1061 RepID=UPI0040271D75